MKEQEHIDALKLLGVNYFNKKEFKEALDVFREVEKRSPNDSEVWFNLGATLAELGENTKAQTYFEKVLEAEPKNSQAMYSMGQLHQNTNDRWMAMHWYTLSLEQEPNNPQVFNNIGKLFYDFDGDYKKSIEQMEKALKVAPNPLDRSLAVVYQNLGKMHRQMLNHEQAEDCKKKWFECQGLIELYWLSKDSDDENDTEE